MTCCMSRSTGTIGASGGPLFAGLAVGLLLAMKVVLACTSTDANYNYYQYITKEEVILEVVLQMPIMFLVHYFIKCR